MIVDRIRTGVVSLYSRVEKERLETAPKESLTTDAVELDIDRKNQRQSGQDDHSPSPDSEKDETSHHQEEGSRRSAASLDVLA